MGLTAGEIQHKRSRIDLNRSREGKKELKTQNRAQVAHEAQMRVLMHVRLESQKKRRGERSSSHKDSHQEAEMDSRYRATDPRSCTNHN